MVRGGLQNRSLFGALSLLHSRMERTPPKKGPLMSNNHPTHACRAVIRMYQVRCLGSKFGA